MAYGTEGSAAIRSVRLSDYPCALAGIRNGREAWMFPSERLIDAGIYPRGGALPQNAEVPWEEMTDGNIDHAKGDGSVIDWFDTFNREGLEDVYVGEEYLPVPVTEALLVLLTPDEGDLAEDEDDDDD